LEMWTFQNIYIFWIKNLKLWISKVMYN
jgi:hypothetical protein